MKVAAIVSLMALTVVLLCAFLPAQVSAKAVTVPVTLDHNRIVIDVYFPLKDGTTKRVRGLVDTGSSQAMLSQRVVEFTGGTFLRERSVCTATIPGEFQIGGLRISLAGMGRALMPERSKETNDVMIAGMSPEVLIPATVLKNYDLVIDYANRQFTIGPQGSVRFTGTAVPIKVANDGLIGLSAGIDGRIYDLGLDTGLSASLVKPAQFDQWHKSEPNWANTAGALATANMDGSADELHREMLRLPALRLGMATLRDVLVATSAEAAADTITGLVGGEAFKGTRLGIDYAHSSLYVEQVNSVPTVGLDVVGLTLRPEVDGRYTVVAVVPFDGQPSVPDVRAGDVLIGVDGAPVTGATMGQVWSLLGGSPGQVRKLIVERDGKRLAVGATVRRFLAAKAN